MSRRFVIVFALLASLTANMARAETLEVSPEPKRGGGLIFGGIMATIGSAMVGVVALGVSVSSCNYRPCSQVYGPELAVAGLGAAAGMVGGISLIGMGVDKRHKWKEWKKAQQDDAGAGGSTTLNLTVFNARTTGLALSHDF